MDIDKLSKEQSQILVVGDSSPSLSSTSALISQFGFSVHTADHMGEIESLVSNKVFAAIFFDFHLFGEKTTTIARWFKSKTPHTPLLVLSSDNDVPIIRKLLNKKIINAFLLKPLSQKTLVNIFDQFIIKDNLPISTIPNHPLTHDINHQSIISFKWVQQIADLSPNPNYYFDIASDCMTSINRLIKIAIAYYQDNKYECVRDTLHSIKGMANNIGAYQVGKQAAFIQDLSNTELLESFEGQVMRLIMFVRLFNNCIENAISVSDLCCFDTTIS
jgi:response regulator RpfG family c-di-GMP phosphodiesterase